MIRLGNPTRRNTETRGSDAAGWLERVVTDPDHPVVLFGTGWCGYCWAARDVLKQLGVAYLYKDAESTNSLDGLPPAQVRAALRDRTGSHTVPQIFIGGESIGGATELMGAFRSGRLASLLDAHAIAHKPM